MDVLFFLGLLLLVLATVPKLDVLSLEDGLAFSSDQLVPGRDRLGSSGPPPCKAESEADVPPPGPPDPELIRSIEFRAVRSRTFF